MKRTLKTTAILVLTALAMTFGMISCSENEAMAQEPQPEVPDGSDRPDDEDIPGSDNILVAYFSCANHVPDGTDAVSGATNKARNTQTVAMELAGLTGGRGPENIIQHSKQHRRDTIRMDQVINHSILSTTKKQQHETEGTNFRNRGVCHAWHLWNRTSRSTGNGK